VISFFFAFFRATRRSRSACVISSCPSATSPAWMVSIGHFYFAQNRTLSFCGDTPIRKEQEAQIVCIIWRARKPEILVQPRKSTGGGSFGCGQIRPTDCDSRLGLFARLCTGQTHSAIGEER
jgi:hypothetical protein